MAQPQSDLLDDPLSLMLSGHGHTCYSLYFNSNKTLLGAAGAGGSVTVFDTSTLVKSGKTGSTEEDEETAGPLVSAPIHRRWASGVLLLEYPGGDPQEPFTISSSDDAHLVLCRLRRPSSGVTNLVPVSKIGPQIHTGGIFGMDANFSGGTFRVLSGSKDGTIGVTRFEGAFEALVFEQKFQDFSDERGVIKSVMWNPHDPHNFAAAGNDRVVRLFDLRSGQAVTEFPGLHTMVVNTVDFNPGTEHQLLSSGFDQTIQVLDTRQTQKPLFTLQGHHLRGRGKPSLTSPIYYLGGKTIATIGDGTTCLFRYSTTTGELDSVVDVGFTPTCLQTFKEESMS